MSEVNEAGGRRFFLQAIDAGSDCPCYEVGFPVFDVAELFDLIGEDIDTAAYCHDLSPEIAKKVVDRYNLQFDSHSYTVRMRPSCTHDSLPYRIHTGRELLLMLRGEKPLAMFDCLDGQDVPTKDRFDSYVATGQFVKREYRDPMDPSYRYFLYALPHEEWRIDAYILLIQAVNEEGWSDGLIRLQGKLLGYSKSQNDIFMTYLRRWRHEDAARRQAARASATKVVR